MWLPNNLDGCPSCRTAASILLNLYCSFLLFIQLITNTRFKNLVATINPFIPKPSTISPWMSFHYPHEHFLTTLKYLQGTLRSNLMLNFNLNPRSRHPKKSAGIHLSKVTPLKQRVNPWIMLIVPYTFASIPLLIPLTLLPF